MPSVPFVVGRSDRHRSGAPYRPRLPDLLRFLVVCLIWGGSFWLMKASAEVFGALTIGAARVTLGGAALALWVLLRERGRAAGRLRPALRRRPALLGFACVVVLGFVYPFWMQPLLIRELGHSGFIGMTVAVVPLVTILASVVLLREKPTARECFGVGAGLLAMPLLAGAGGTLGVGPVALALALSVPVAYAVSNTLIRSSLSAVGPVRLTAGACAAAAVFLVPLAATQEPVRWAPTAGANLRAAGALLALATLGTGLAVALFYRLIQTRGPLYAGMVTYVIPVEALLLGWLDGERVTPLQGVALGVVLASVALVQLPLRWPLRPPTSRSRPSPAASAGAGPPAPRPPAGPAGRPAGRPGPPARPRRAPRPGCAGRP